LRRLVRHIARGERTARFVYAALSLVVALSLVASAAIPAWPAPGAAPHSETRISQAGRTETLPVLNERQERPAVSTAKVVQLTLPTGVLEYGPVIYGSVILPVRNDVTLSSYFVYSQTTSSRL
jgi:hypothetical protein